MSKIFCKIFRHGYEAASHEAEAEATASHEAKAKAEARPKKSHEADAEAEAEARPKKSHEAEAEARLETTKPKPKPNIPWLCEVNAWSSKYIPVIGHFTILYGFPGSLH